MSTLTDLIKESLEGKLSDQIRTSLEADSNEMNEAKSAPLFVDTPEAEAEIKKVKPFGIYTEAYNKPTGKIIIGYTNEGRHFMIKPSSAKMLDKATNGWKISQFELVGIFKNTRFEDLWLIYSIDTIDGRSPIRGVKTYVLTFWAGEYGELFNSKKDAQAAIKNTRHVFHKTPKVCQIKDCQNIIKANEKNVDWMCNGLRFL